MIGRIRPVEIRVFPVQEATLVEMRAEAERGVPDGWELTSPPVRTADGYVAVAARRDGQREIEAPTVDALRGAVPDGWQLLYVMAG